MTSCPPLPEPDSETRAKPTLGLLPLLAVTAAIASPAMAQETGDEKRTRLGTIILGTVLGGGEAANGYKVSEGSSDKLTAPLADTPKSIVVITQKQMEERNATSVLEVLRTTPGITLGSGEGGTPMGDRFFMRGYQAATDLMIDGIRNLGRTSNEAFNVESVEVVKGPGGAYSGRGATGGSINLVTKEARVGESWNHASVSLGNGDHKRLTYDGNLDLGQDMALRFNLMVQDSGVPGRDVLKDDRKGVALAFTKEFGASKFTAGLYHSEANSTPDLGVPMETAGWRTRIGGPAISTDNPGRPIEVMPSDAFFGSAYRDFRDVTNQSAMLKFEHNFSDSLKWSTTLAWIGSEQYYIVSRPTMSGTTDMVNRDLRSGGKKNSALAFQTALSGSFTTGSINHDFAFGFEHSKEKVGSATSTGSPSLPTTPVTNPNPYDPVGGTPLVWTGWGVPIETTTSALYLFDTLHLNPQWSLDLGLRYDRYKIFDGTRSRKDTMLNYSAAVVYKPVENGTIYFSIGTSSNPSGECAGMAGGADGAGACTLTAANVNLEPEKSKSYELGTKWELFDDRLLLSAAIFRTEKKNARVTDPITGDVALIGENHAQGIELGVAGQINDRWGLSMGYAYTDAVVDFAGGTDRSLDGKEMQFSAKNSFNLWSTWQVSDRFTIGGGATFTDKRWLNAANTLALPSQWRVDAMFAYELTENAVLQVNVNNLFDERLYDASHVGLFANRAPGRAIVAKIDYRF